MTAKSKAETTQMLKVEGAVELYSSFFDRIEESIRAAVSDALNKALAEARESTPKVQPLPKYRGLELDLDEPIKASKALRDKRSWPKTKEGRGMIDTKTLAKLMDISYRALFSFMSQGAILEPVTIGNRMKRWPIEEVMSWIYNGCASTEQWSKIRKTVIRDYRLTFIHLDK